MHNGIIGIFIFDEFRAAQVDDGAFFLQDDPFQIAGFIRTQDGSFENEHTQKGQDDLKGLGKRLPEDHVHAVGINGQRNPFSGRQLS